MLNPHSFRVVSVSSQTTANPAWRIRLVLDAGASYDNDGDGVADADFAERAGVIVTDRSAPERGSACGTVLEVDPASGALRVEIRSGVLGPRPTGATVGRAPPARSIGRALPRGNISMSSANRIQGYLMASHVLTA